jgi:23S rRNA (pseudouridine1915-N3)-methyltransferase
MQITIIAVGKIKEKYLQDGIAEYEKRLRPFLKLKILEIPEEKRPRHTLPSQENPVKLAEGGRIIDSIPPESYPVALDVNGVHWSSEELAGAFRKWEISGRNHLAFIIGGDLGLSDDLLKRCPLHLSLSSLTFTHQMARMILLEQIYRAEKINRGEPYHK